MLVCVVALSVKFVEQLVFTMCKLSNTIKIFVVISEKLKLVARKRKALAQILGNLDTSEMLIGGIDLRIALI